ncbi:MAG: cysteine hydrolase [Chloroflexota bacterium]
MIATDKKRNWDAFVLLLVDVQVDFWNEKTAVINPNFAQNITQLLHFCRSEGLEVVHLRAGFQPDKSDWMTRYKLGNWTPCVVGTAGVDPLPCAVEQPNEQMFIKQTFDGFHNPQLDAYLQVQGKQVVLVAGLLTSVCVLLTAASAAQRGYLTAVIEDCSADRSAMHSHVLDNYHFIFNTIHSAELTHHYDSWQAKLRQLGEITP